MRSSPSAASTSEEPDAELAARLPCLMTGTPDAAATIEAIVETFTVPNRSPPVPTMSSAIGSTGSGDGVLEDRVAEADDLVDGLALRPQRDEERGELGVGRRARHDLLHAPRGIRHAEVFAVEQGGEDGWPDLQVRHVSDPNRRDSQRIHGALTRPVAGSEQGAPTVSGRS